jgi:uncharacterized protein YhaN
MSESVQEVSTGSQGAPAEPSVEAILEAVDLLERRIQEIQQRLSSEKERADALASRLETLAQRAGVEDPERLSDALDDYRRLREEERRWTEDRRRILQVVEGLIRKVDALGTGS